MAITGRPINDQQPRIFPIAQRVLGNELFWKLKVEVFDRCLIFRKGQMLNPVPKIAVALDHILSGFNFVGGESAGRGVQPSKLASRGGTESVGWRASLEWKCETTGLFWRLGKSWKWSLTDVRKWISLGHCGAIWGEAKNAADGHVFAGVGRKTSGFPAKTDPALGNRKFCRKTASLSDARNRTVFTASYRVLDGVAVGRVEASVARSRGGKGFFPNLLCTGGNLRNRLAGPNFGSNPVGRMG